MKLRHASEAPLVLFATGSTGGHVAPAIAMAEALDALGQPLRTVFCGPAAGVAERMVASMDGAFVPLEIHPLRGGSAVRWVRGLAALPMGAINSYQLMRELNPDLVVGTGAHTSGPLVAVAALLGIPTLLFEANVEVGLANRWLGPLVQAAAVAWPQTLGSFRGREFLTGWPVRRAIRTLARRELSEPGRFHLLILGGSAGASDLDRAVRECLPHIGSLARSLAVVHQASPGEVTPLLECYLAAGVDAVVEPFFADLVEHYQRASLVITRAGASTLAELAAVGLPAILVPLTAAGDHQRSNARAWEEAGCARTVLPHELNGRTLAAAILALAQDGPARARMGQAARSWHRPDAAAKIAAWCDLAVRPK